MTSPPTTPYILIEEGRSIEIAATIDGSTLRLAARPLLESVGWAQKPEGLCKGDVCIPIANCPDLINEHGVDLVALGEVLGRPVVINRDESAAALCRFEDRTRWGPSSSNCSRTGSPEASPAMQAWPPSVRNSISRR